MIQESPASELVHDAIRPSVTKTPVENPKAPTARKRSGYRVVLWIGGIIAVGLAAVWFFPALRGVKDNRATLPESSTLEQKSDLVYITSSAVQTQTVRRAVDVVGTLFGYEEIVISANVEGRVTRLTVDVADRVSAGAELGEIDPTNYELAVRQAQRSLDVELARLGLEGVPPKDFKIENLPMIRDAQSRLTYARYNEERTQELARSKAVSAQDLESATADLQSAQATYDNQLLQARAAIATIQLRSEALDIARQQLQDTEIHAPIPENPIPFVDEKAIYAIAARNVSEGSFVRVGGEVFRLVIDDTLRLRVAVPERHLGEIAVAQNAEVSTSAYDEPFVGKVARINPVIDASTRTYEVEVLIDNTSHRLKPGGFAKTKIITSENDTAVTVPLESVVTFAGITKVFLINDNKATEVQVKLGQQGTDWVEVVSPKIEVGSRIVTSGQTALSEGTPVTERTAKEL